jgi:hypothetical protein
MTDRNDRNLINSLKKYHAYYGFRLQPLTISTKFLETLTKQTDKQQLNL